MKKDCRLVEKSWKNFKIAFFCMQLKVRKERRKIGNFFNSIKRILLSKKKEEKKSIDVKVSWVKILKF